MDAAAAVSLFSGIGGLDLALEAHGWRIIAQVENDPLCQWWLGRHWPDVPCYGDVERIDWHDFSRRHGPVELVAAGFPCQPVSNAGRRKAQADARWLWPEVARCLRVLRPRHVFLENTLGLLSRGAYDVFGDLAALGFDAEWDCLQAADVGAPHERDRVFILAYPAGGGWLGREDGAGVGNATSVRGQAVGVTEQRGGAVGHPAEPGRPQRGRGSAPLRSPNGHLRGQQQPGRSGVDGGPGGRRHEAESGVGGDAARLPHRLDGHRWPAPPIPPHYPQHEWEPFRTVGRGVPHRGRRVSALGNAVVPQQGALAFRVLWERMLAAQREMETVP